MPKTSDSDSGKKSRGGGLAARRIAGACVVVALVLGSLVVGWSWLRPVDPLEAARSAYLRRDWNAAEDSARLAVRRSTTDRAALRLLARVSARLGRDGTAQTLFRQLGAADAEAEDFFLLGGTLADQGDDPQAVLMYEQARKIDPSHAENLQALANWYLKADYPLAAVETLASDPKRSAETAWMLARACERLGDPAGTAKALREALALDPTASALSGTSTSAWLRLARASLSLGKPSEALKALESAGASSEVDWLASRAFLQQDDAEKARASLARAEAFAKDQPARHEPAPYAGSAACLGCHFPIGRLQTSSRHAHTFGRSDEVAGGLGELPGPILDPGDRKTHHRIVRDGPGVKVEADPEGEIVSALVAYAIGSGNRADSMLVRDALGSVREYRLTRYADPKVGWDLTPKHSEHPSTHADFLGQTLIPDMVRDCVQCHFTDALLAESAESPLRKERGIGCERCHGPAGNHLKAVALKLDDPAIGRPRLATSATRIALCAQCHQSLRGDTSQSLDAARFAWPTMGRSRCYTESQGAFDCMTCHNPHGNVDHAAATYEKKCLDCHGGKVLASIERVPAVCKVNAKSDCLSCHMKKVVDAVPHSTFTDHYIRVPTQQTERTSR